LKGTTAQAELHFLRQRLQGGKLNKAKKGELRCPLPVGYSYDEQGGIFPDPDEEVRGAVFASSRKRAVLVGDATVPRTRVTLSQAGLWWSLER
jgi:DNA invertase Pin-like site-specific DNA recombinase